MMKLDSKECDYQSVIKTVLDATPLCINLWDDNYNNVLCNKYAKELFDLNSEEQYLKEFASLSPEYQPNGEKSSELAKTHIEKALSDGINIFKWLHCKKDGTEIPAEITLTKIKISDKNYIAGFTRDLRNEFSQNTLAGSYSEVYEDYFFDKISDGLLLRKLSELSNEWFFSLDIRTSHIQYYGIDAIQNRNHQGIALPLELALERGFIHPDDTNLYKLLITNMKNGRSEALDIRFKMPAGNFRYFRYSYLPVYNNEDKLVFVIGKSTDVHEEKILSEKSKMDLLTGCYNKISAENIISEKLLKDKNSQHAFFIVDIDNFKAVNDNLGHFFGDEVLKEVATELKAVFRGSDIVARIGGDEFIVFVENVVDLQLVEERAQKIAVAFKKTYSGLNKEYDISGSIGVSLFPKMGTSYSDLYKAADKALYQAKLLGKNQYVFYSDDLQGGTMRNLTKLENANRIASSYFDKDLIDDVFQELYNNDGDDESINTILKLVSDKYNADRSYIFEIREDRISYDNTYEFAREGISKEMDTLQNVGLDVFGQFFTSEQGGILYSNNLAETFSEKASFETMYRQGIKSFVQTYVRKNDTVEFVFGLDDCTNNRVWTEKELNSVLYISKILSMMRRERNKAQVTNTLESVNTFALDKQLAFTTTGV